MRGSPDRGQAGRISISWCAPQVFPVRGTARPGQARRISKSGCAPQLLSVRGTVRPGQARRISKSWCAPQVFPMRGSDGPGAPGASAYPGARLRFSRCAAQPQVRPSVRHSLKSGRAYGTPSPAERTARPPRPSVRQALSSRAYRTLTPTGRTPVRAGTLHDAYSLRAPVDNLYGLIPRGTKREACKGAERHPFGMAPVRTVATPSRLEGRSWVSREFL
jgi:hypothetical protein